MSYYKNSLWYHLGVNLVCKKCLGAGQRLSHFSFSSVILSVWEAAVGRPAGTWEFDWKPKSCTNIFKSFVQFPLESGLQVYDETRKLCLLIIFVWCECFGTSKLKYLNISGIRKRYKYFPGINPPCKKLITGKNSLQQLSIRLFASRTAVCCHSEVLSNCFALLC